MKLRVMALLALLLPQADRITYYQVSGGTAAQVRAAMNVVRPTDSHGLRVDARTTWDIHWNYLYRTAPTGCVVTSFDVTLTTAMTLPKWTAFSAAPPALQNTWRAYYAALLQHEKGHINIAELAVGAIREAGPKVTASSCSQIGALIDMKGQALLAEYKRQEVRYDAETNHGVKQGAKFP